MLRMLFYKVRVMGKKAQSAQYIYDLINRFMAKIIDKMLND